MELLGGRRALAAAAVCLYWQTSDGHAEPLQTAVASPLLADGLMNFVRWLSLLVGALLLMTAAQGAAEGQAAEYAGSLLIAVAGAMLVAGAGDLVMLFLGLELISIPTYVLLYLGRRDVASQEAALKYFFLSILSSAVMLYGFSFLYGLSGSMELVEIRRASRRHRPPSGEPSPCVTLLLGAGRAGLQDGGRAVPLLRPRRLSGHHARQRRRAGRDAEGGRRRGDGCAWPRSSMAPAAWTSPGSSCWCWPWPR